MNRVRSLREEAGMKQDDLAARLGVNASVVSRYEGGTISLPEDTLRQLTIIFDGVSVDYILGLSDDKMIPGARSSRSSSTSPQIASDMLALSDRVCLLSDDERALLLRCAKNTEALAVAGRFMRLSGKSKRRVVEYMDLLKLAEDAGKNVSPEDGPASDADGQ